MKGIVTEICADSLNSAIAAEKGGGDRIELCQALSVGGLTPSASLITYCCKNLSIPVFVLIRPRAGGFCYNREEFDLMMEEIRFCKKAGASGVVIGFLKRDGSIDKERLKEAIYLAWPMEVTFHRAFDCCNDWEKSLEDIIECRCNRILTSGQKETAEEGKEVLKRIVEKAGKRITILVGSGITKDNVAEIINCTGTKEVHFSAKHPVIVDNEFSHNETSQEIVQKIVAIVKS